MREDKRKKGKTIIVNLNYSQAGFHEINRKSSLQFILLQKWQLVRRNHHRKKITFICLSTELGANIESQKFVSIVDKFN